MITTLSGRLTHKTPTWVVVETGGVGFHVIIPVSSYEALGEPGREVRILTYLHVREDTLQLYGFATEGERRLFLLLISVSGIGCKLAQGVLSGIPVVDFERAVRSQDIHALIKVPGVGRKTAERLVLELKDKIGEPKTGGEAAMTAGPVSMEEEAVLALVSLGYRRTQAQDAVQKTLRLDSALALEEVIRRALRII
jgi:Holliday junction DNA helicase RuvA